MLSTLAQRAAGCLERRQAVGQVTADMDVTVLSDLVSRPHCLPDDDNRIAAQRVPWEAPVCGNAQKQPQVWHRTDMEVCVAQS